MNDITVLEIVQRMLVWGAYDYSLPDGGILAARLAPLTSRRGLFVRSVGRLAAHWPSRKPSEPRLGRLEPLGCPLGSTGRPMGLCERPPSQLGCTTGPSLLI